MATHDGPTRRSLDSLERIVDRRMVPADRRWHEGHAQLPKRRADNGQPLQPPRDRTKR